MSASTSTPFRTQVKFWGIRGVACAAPSFRIALTTGYSDPREVAGMIVATATLIFAMAWLTAWPRYAGSVGASHFGRSFRMAANLRAILAVLGFAMLGSGSLPHGLAPYFTLLTGLDFWTGLLAVGGTGIVAEAFHQVANDAVNSFGWTYLTTLLDGALVTVTLGVLAVGLTLLSRLIPRRSVRNDIAHVR